MNSYRNTLSYLYGLQGRGMKFGLRNIKLLLKSVGNPERKFHSIHVAGTNGKGSTASFLASVFTEAGYDTGLYTSPHLIQFSERIRVNGIQIPEARLVAYAEQLQPLIEKTQATFFEATTCIAFQYFAEERIDIAIIEAGMGGRLDSTNVLQPLVSVITNVSFDHMEYLGRTLVKITREKGGIIKRGVPCVTSSDNKVVVRTLRGIARRKRSVLVESNKRIKLSVVESRHKQFIANFQSQNLSVRNVRVGLRGIHQTTNAMTAVAAIDVLERGGSNAKTFSRLTAYAIRRGLEKVQENTGLHGRFENYDKQFILDVAHNRAGLHALAESLSPHMKSESIVVFGVMKDKEYQAMCEIIASMGMTIIAVHPKGSRALKASQIAFWVNSCGGKATNGGSVRNGILAAKKLAGSKGRILVTGSHYVVGEAMEFLLKN